MNRRAQALHGIALLLAACLAQAEPFGYVVNSDSLSDTDFDQLYRVDLATGDATLIGPVGFSDVEGLALSPDGVLYGVDDATETLIVIDTNTGQGKPVNSTPGNLGIEVGQGYDFGLAFDANGTLWLSSDTTGMVWTLDLDTGMADVAPFAGSGPMARVTTADGFKNHGGSPVALTGLGGCDAQTFGVGSTGHEEFYAVDADDGPSLIGSLGDGLSFGDAGADLDAEGNFWVIADRSTDVNGNPLNEPSIILTVDLETGAASRVATTIVGVESLAISAPGPCPANQHVGGHEIPALSRPGTALLALLLALVAGAFLRRAAW